MNSKNQLPIQWIIGIIILLVVLVSRIHEASKIMTIYSASHGTSHNNFLQFLENMIGVGDQVDSFNEASKKNNLSNKNNPGSGQMQGFDSAGNPQNPDFMASAGALGSQGGSAASQGGSDGNSPESVAEKNAEVSENAENSHEDRSDNSSGNNPNDNAELNAAQEIGNTAESNSELGVENNSETNSELIAGINSETNAENNSGNNPEDNAEINSENNQGNNPSINAETNAQNNAANNSGDNSGNNSGGSSGDNSGGSSGDNSGVDNSGGSNSGSNLPTINPIPSDDQVSQSIAKQDQQSDALASLIAGRQALVVPVQQQAQASKYQTVTSQSIPAPSTSQPPADVEAKVQAKQLTYH